MVPPGSHGHCPGRARRVGCDGADGGPRGQPARARRYGCAPTISAFPCSSSRTPRPPNVRLRTVSCLSPRTGAQSRTRCTTSRVRRVCALGSPRGTPTRRPSPLPDVEARVLQRGLPRSYDLLLSAFRRRWPSADTDVIADLRTTSLSDAIELHLVEALETTRARLHYFVRATDDPYRDFHCHFCMKRYGKLAHLGLLPNEPPSTARRLHVVE